jgi:hypothetical protein
MFQDRDSHLMLCVYIILAPAVLQHHSLLRDMRGFGGVRKAIAFSSSSTPCQSCLTPLHL